MPTMEEIMLTFNAKDNVSNVAKNIDGSVKSMASSLKSAIGNASSGFMNLSSTTEGFFQSLTGGKNASDIIFGTSSKAETNKVLLSNMTETAAGAEALYKTVDEVTNKSLTSMQELIPAMNAFKAATGASDSELTNVTDDMANFGAAVLAQTGSTELAQTAMMDLSKGIKGAFASLDQYGVSEDALMRTGLWSGREDDVEGYMAAVTEVIGSTEALMETNEGLDAQIGKAFSRAGKKIGNEFLPFIKDIKRGFLDLDNALGGNLSAGILATVQGIEFVNQGLFQVTTMVEGVNNLKTAWNDVSSVLSGVKDKLNSIGSAGETASNVTEIATQYAPGATDVLPEAKPTTQYELGDTDVLDFDEFVKNKKNKNYDEFLKYLDEDEKELKKVQKALDSKKIDKKEFKTLTDTITKDKKSLINLFEEAGEIPDIDIRKTKKNSWDDYLKNVIKSNQDMEDVLKTMSKGDLNISSADSIVKNIKKEKEDFATKLLEINDLPDIDLDKNKTKSMSKAVDVLDDVDVDVPDMKNAKKMTKVADGVEDVVEGASNIGKLAPEAAAASAKTATFSSAFAGFGASLGAMIAPILMVSIAVAIIIPIIGALAAEALLVARGVAEVIKALDFDSLDLSKSIEGIKQVGSAMWELARAMGAMTLAGAAAYVYNFISAIMGFKNPVQEAVTHVKEAITIVNQLASVSEVNSGIPDKLKALSTSLQSVGEAMGSMSDVTWSVLMGGLMTLGGRLESYTDNLRVAKTELTNAVNILNEFGGLSTVNEGVVNKLKAVTDALSSAGTAMGKLGDINWAVGMTNLNPFSDVAAALEQTKDDIIQASEVLNTFTGIKDIPENVGSNLQKVSSALESASKALQSLSKIDSEVSLKGGNPFKDVIVSLRSAKDDIFDAAEILATLNDIHVIPEGTGDKIQRVGWTATNVVNAIKTLNKIQGVELDAESLITTFQNARSTLFKVSAQLAALMDISAIPEGLGDKIQRVAWTAATVKNAIVQLNSVQGVELNASELITMFQNARSTLFKISAQLAALIDISAIPEGLGEKIQRVAWTASSVSNAITSLNKVPVVNTNVNIQGAVTAIKNAVTQLNQLNGTNLSGNISTLLTTVTNTLNQLKATIAAMSGSFTASGVLIGSSIVAGVQTGLAPLPTVVISSVSSATASAASTGWTGGSRIGTSVTNGFKSALKLAAAMKTEMGYVTQAVNSGISAAKSAAQRGAAEIVEAFKSGIETGSPGAMAWAMFDEMGYIRDFIVSEGKHVVTSAKKLGQNIVDSFGNPTLSLDSLSKIANGTFTAEHIGSMETMMSRAPPSADNRPVSIYIYEGAVQLDARNLTTRESKQVMINALEGLDAINNINIRGI